MKVIRVTSSFLWLLKTSTSLHRSPEECTMEFHVRSKSCCRCGSLKIKESSVPKMCLRERRGSLLVVCEQDCVAVTLTHKEVCV